MGVPWQPADPQGWSRPPKRRGEWFRRMPLWLQILVAVWVVVLFGIVVFGLAGSNHSDSPQYQQAVQECLDGPGAAWYAAHPGVDIHDPAVVTAFAAVINRCLVDQYGVDPKYLPNKPLAPPG